MRSFYNITKYLRDTLASFEDVNTVSFGPFPQGDYEKKNIYPIAMIEPTSSSFPVNGNVIEFTFDIGVFDQRDLSNDMIVDKFYSNDNEIDNLNMCHATLNLLVSTLRNENNPYNIEIVGISNLTPLVRQNLNILDGWGLTIVVQMPNLISTC